MADARPAGPHGLPRGLLFLDLETTGLIGGAGTYAFLVGCVVRRRDVPRTPVPDVELAGERGLLRALADLGRAAGTVVSYNGKSFDLPLIDTRYPSTGCSPLSRACPTWTCCIRRGACGVLWATTAATRTGGPWTGYGVTESACRLVTLERTLCGFAREGDVPGFEIPERSFTFVRTGDARPLEGVLEHNRLDLLSLAFVTSHACQLLDEGPHAARGPREALGLGRIYLGRGPRR